MSEPSYDNPLTVKIPAESRVYRVLRDDRIIEIPAEDRTDRVPAEER